MNAKRNFHRILIGIDSKGLALSALHQGLTLAKTLKLPVDILHVVELPPPYWAGISDEKLMSLHAAALAEAREQVLEHVRAACKAADFTLVQPEDMLHVAAGHPAEVLLETARDKGSDLLLIGQHARRSLFDFGNTARAILSQTPAPLWVQAGEVAPLRRILVPIDFSEHSRRALEHAKELAWDLGAAVRVLHAYAPTVFAHTPIPDVLAVPTVDLDQERTAAKEELEAWVQGIEWGDVDGRSIFVEGDVRQALQAEAKSCDLIVMGTHGRTGLSRFLLGSVTYAALKEATRPVLVIPDTERSWLLEAAPASVEGSKIQSSSGLTC
jgi:nucleotide-binding universal stress UspA family protein